jgi:hypothetical protein
MASSIHGNPMLSVRLQSVRLLRMRLQSVG